nr:DUF983 domain-containing protein [uncultured Roseococcus sp.]
MTDIAATTWERNRAAPASPYVAPPLKTAMWRGLRNRCPFCDQGKVFKGFLRVVDNCEHCDAPLGKLRADDAPPYFTIFIAGHLFIPPVLWIERIYSPPMWIQMCVWVPLFAIATTLLLRPVKGATVGLMSRFGFTQPQA